MTTHSQSATHGQYDQQHQEEVPRSLLTQNAIHGQVGLTTTQLIELGFVDEKQRIKVFEKECPAINHIMVYDIRLNVDEALEDLTYSFSPDLQYNLRRGHTIAEVYDPENFDIKKYSCVARKGPRKYYHIRIEDLTDDDTYFQNYDPNFAQTQVEYDEAVKAQSLRNFTLSPVLESLSQGHHVEVYRSTFTVGENTQISWLAGEGAWVIASQHASVFVRNHDDLQMYESQSKYAHFAPFTIAKYWLDYFEHHIHDKEGFINGVSGRTLCGTFIDNSNFSTILKYKEPTLIFHTIVQNDSDDQNCILPVHCYEFFALHNIKVAPLEKVGDFDNFPSLLSSLTELHSLVSNCTLKEEQRGSVCYFVSKGTTDQKVLTMGKIETKEYLILTQLAKTLSDFWVLNEKITQWTPQLGFDYNAAYESFLYQLEFYAVPNYDFYKSIAEVAFSTLKEDIELYAIFKKSLCDFYIDILSRLGFCDEAFVVDGPHDDSLKEPELVHLEETKQVVNGSGFDSSAVHEIVEKVVEDQPVEKVKKHVEKHKPAKPSNKPVEEPKPAQTNKKPSHKAKHVETKPKSTKITEKPASKKPVEPKPKKPSHKKQAAKEDEANKAFEPVLESEPTQMDMNLEDIIGTVKTQAPTTKSIKKKGKGKKGAKPSKTTKTQPALKTQSSTERAQKVTKEATPVNTKSSKAPKPADHWEKVPPNKSSKTGSRKTSIEELKVDEVDEEPAVELHGYEAITYQSSVIDKSTKMLTNKTYFTHEEIDPSVWFLVSSQYQLDYEIDYVGNMFSDQNSHPVLHAVPTRYALQSKKHPVFGSYHPFGLKQRRNFISFKNKLTGQGIDLESVVYNHDRFKALITNMFSEEAAVKFISAIRHRSYKHNTSLYYKNVDFWYAKFRIMASVFKNAYNTFISKVTNRALATKSWFYSSSIAPIVFSSVSNSSVGLLSACSHNDYRFTLVLSNFLRHATKSKTPVNYLIRDIDKFISEAPESFWDVLYRDPALSEFTSPIVKPLKKTSSSPQKSAKKGKKKAIKGKKKTKKVIIREKADDEFRDLFNQEQEELEKSLREERKNEEAKLAMVTSIKAPKAGEAPPKKSKDADADKKTKKLKEKQQREAERARQEKEKQRQRDAQEKKDKLEAERKAKKLAEKEKKEQEKKQREDERLKKEKAEKKRKDDEKRKKEEEKRKQDEIKKQKDLEAKLAKEEAEKERKEKERLEKERKEKERIEKEQLEKERKEQEAKEKARLAAEADKKRKKEEAEKKRKAEEAEKKRKQEEAEKKRKAEEARKLKEEQEKQRIKEEQEKKRKEKEEADRKKKIEEEAKAKKEAEAKARKEREAKAKKDAEIKAKKEAEIKAKKEAEAKAKKEAEIKAKQEAEDKAKKEAELKAKKEAELKAKKEAEDKAKQEAEEAKAKKEAEAKAKKDAANAKKKKKAEAKKKKKAEARAKKEADENAKKEAELKKQQELAAKKEEEQKRHQEDSDKLKSIENAQKAHKDMINKQIHENKTKADLSKLEQMERLQKEHVAEIQAQIKANKETSDQKRLEKIETSQKDHHDHVMAQIVELKKKADAEKLKEIEAEQKEKHDTINKQVKAKKIASDIRKLSEIEEHQKEAHDTINKQIKAKKIASDIRKLSEMEEHQKEAHDEINKQIKAKQIAGDIKKLSNVQEQQKSNKSALNAEIKQKKDEDDQKKLSEIQQQHSQRVESINKEIKSQKHEAVSSAAYSTTPTKTINLSDGTSGIGLNSDNPFKVAESSPVSSTPMENSLGGSIRRSRGQRLKNRNKDSDTNTDEKPLASSRNVEEGVKVIRSSLPVKPMKSIIANSQTANAPRASKPIKRKSPTKPQPKPIEETKGSGYIPSGRKPTVVSTSSAKKPSKLSAKKPKTTTYLTGKRTDIPPTNSVKKSTVNIKDIHYLGMTPFAKGHEELINQQLVDSLAKLVDKYPCDFLTQLHGAAKEGVLDSLGWTVPAPLHITSALINGKATTKNKKSLEEFKIGIEESLNLNCLVVCEDMFISALMKPKLVDINSKIPYMGLWFNGCKPKDCTTILESILYKIKPKMGYAEEKLRTYYAICEKSIFKDDVLGEVSINFDSYKNKKVWYIFIKDSVKTDFVTFIKKLNE